MPNHWNMIRGFIGKVDHFTSKSPFIAMFCESDVGNGNRTSALRW